MEWSSPRVLGAGVGEYAYHVLEWRYLPMNLLDLRRCSNSPVLTKLYILHGIKANFFRLPVHVYDGWKWGHVVCRRICKWPPKISSFFKKKPYYFVENMANDISNCFNTLLCNELRSCDVDVTHHNTVRLATLRSTTVRPPTLSSVVIRPIYKFYYILIKCSSSLSYLHPLDLYIDLKIVIFSL